MDGFVGRCAAAIQLRTFLSRFLRTGEPQCGHASLVSTFFPQPVQTLIHR